MSTDTLFADAAQQSGRSQIQLDSDAPGVLTAAAGGPGDVERFIDAHRREGHRFAALDPTGEAKPLDPQLISPARFGLSPTDTLTGDGQAWLGARRVGELDRRLKAAYCGALALDASAVRDEDRCAWLYARMESAYTPAQADGQGLLDRLIHAQAWEQHVAERFPDAKRFSLEGCEALVPLLDALIEEAAAHGLSEIFMGMPHRGRVNVLVNVLGLPPAQILDYFDPASPHPEMHSDLVYHLGASRTVSTKQGDISVTLAHNPSHLQSVYPVVTGMTHASRALQRSDKRGQALALVLHGDAAFAGQGVVMETLALSQKPGYSVGGTVHVIINNQVGFTELNLMNAAQARYCTDVTRMIDAPILRVNADAPEQLLRAAAIALDYRMSFGSDVVIDLIGYRRLGHSEHDLPKLTNPVGYAATDLKPTVVEVYGSALVSAGLASQAEMAAYIASRRSAATATFSDTSRRFHEAAPSDTFPVPPAVPFTQAALGAAVAAMTQLPKGFEPHEHIQALIERWQRVASGETNAADWCFAENMAYASVLSAGVDVRISGLDVRRGTFMHRHAAWHNQASQHAGQEDLIPLRQLGAPGRFDVVNSVLSEEAVVGFEYGYSLQASRGLTVWEAQFGDFVNGAQVYLDQYISAGEEKWGARSALAMLLPHGHEGVGPEHSNAHLGRFLSLCGGDNLRVAYPSTSAQLFHLLRRQAFCEVRKPLVVMTPKVKLYKEPGSHSPVEQLLAGEFQPVLDDSEISSPSEVTRLVLCSGKLYYQLQRARLQHALADVALVRVEELYPFPTAVLARVLERYPRLRTLVWAQEENLHHGAWSFVRDDLNEACPHGVELRCVSRPNTASGATSSYAVHHRQERELVAEAMGLSTARR
ncbi:2-oxoglutarate dehydrogenase E1 component [Aquabacterium sp. A7-Y]|uniref:2-oxoglutarate dehydrogenase E1 component n=1 Tax=Aquabacterium sp. A7-Y TaxID=1349605 RepID=UPI00223DD4FD|nr:2-oxoglutarate dehydrogenase E1 component [Aquabacterium sp. A7-Y]MCW7540140.1 2-oxoglutarate dehydrogenase E1 component [Aquabacterium sp. A7-Y]